MRLPVGGVAGDRQLEQRARQTLCRVAALVALAPACALDFDQFRIPLLPDVAPTRDATVDVALRGKPSDLRLLGRIEIKDSRFIPNAIDTPVEVKRGVLDLTAGRATLHTLNAVVDGAKTEASGTIDIQSLSPLRFGSIDFRLRGDLSAQLLQWQFARNLAEARGRLALRSLHITGTFVEPIAEGTLVAKDLFLNLRRFHELYFAHGTVTLLPGSGKTGRILIGWMT